MYKRKRGGTFCFRSFAGTLMLLLKMGRLFLWFRGNCQGVQGHLL